MVITPTPTGPICSINYHVSGKQILDQNGNVFIPYGLQIAGPSLAATDWNTQTSNSQYITQTALQQAHDFWHSNTTRLQISSADLFTATSYPNYNKAYLARVDQIVEWANQADMNIIISLQYEVTTHQWMPTQDSINFWKIVAAHYANNPKVFFDIYNEPNPALALCTTGTTDAIWNFWQYGSASSTPSSCAAPVTTYVGMQDLVNAVRATGAQNLIFAEGPAQGETLNLLPSHILTGTNIVFAIHPYGALSNASQWDTNYGNPANSVNAPVVADEWSQDEHNIQACTINAPTLVPQFLTYLKAHQIGLIAFAYIPGSMVKGTWDITNPTSYSSTTTVCPGNVTLPDTNPNLEGSGQLVQQYFIQNSVISSCLPSTNVTQTPTTQPTPTPTPPAKPTPAPTATPVPGDTTVDLVVGLHGIGTAGDNASPNTDGNMNPMHTTRSVTVSIYNTKNQ